MAIEFKIPPRWTGELVAETLASYLLGANAFLTRADQARPPFGNDGEKWQLDEGNDFWLRVDGANAQIIARYDEEAAGAMKSLFLARYGRDR